MLHNPYTNMRTELLNLIKGYANDDVTFDTLAAGLQTIIDSEPALLNEILTLLNEIKNIKSADLPLIQKLQSDLEKRVSFKPSSAQPPLSEDSTIVKAQPGPSPEIPIETSEDQNETIIKATGPQAADKTVVQPQTITPDSEKTRVKVEEEPSPTTAFEPEPPVTNKDELEPGSIIKNRFILESLIGEGGMGRVFKARDLRKEEAHDRNPYVAIKVLNETFKEHPQAFIALQREAKKAQTLAHPNIVNVYDFDRDGDTVYMTMEYLTGDSLDRILRKLSPRTLEKPQAITIIRGICAGLSYAHKRNIIHSDLKPGNVFVTEDGETKIFDFGIARAIQSQETSGEKTLFDAGSLGGLTPAYASCEMFEGEEPDVRDDIYALACIAYELLGGKHPFNKTPAIKAKQNAVVPGKLSQLSRRQNKTLATALSFERDTRTPSVNQFLDGLTVRFSKKQKLAFSAVLLVIVIVLVSFEPLSNYMRQKQIENFVADFQTGDEQTIQLALNALTKIPPALRDEILLAVKDPLISYYEKKALSQIDPKKGLVDFNKANRFLNIANALYPDSAQISLAKKNLQQRQQQISAELTTRFQFHLQQGNLLPEKNSDDILDVLDTAEKLDRNHPLLKDKRLPLAYAKQAKNAATQWDFDTATQLLDVATALFPNNQSLQDLQKDIARQQQLHLSKQQQLAAEFDIKKVRQQVDSLLKQPFSQPNWSAVLQSHIQQLAVVLPANDQWLQETKQHIALFHLKRAENLRKQHKFGDARATIKLAQKFSKNFPGLDEELANINRAQEQTVQTRKIQAQKEKVTALKQQILRLANKNDVKEAEAKLNELTALADKQDSFVRKDAPMSIASAYLRLGNNAILRGDSKTAVQFFTAGLKLVPEHKELQSLRKKYSRKASDTCEKSYAGHGKRVTCFDTIGNDKGPILVVIPATKSTKIFAMGKYEVSVADYNLFCKSSKKCPPRKGNSSLPITNVSITDIRNYLQWLSKQTGATYRLPSEQEWIIASRATAQPPGKDFNCRITIGNDIVRGNALLNVKSGKKNSWGLENYVGNAQELVVTSSNQLLAKGGAYQDPLTKCNISFTRKHDGKSDPLTGFRVLREM